MVQTAKAQALEAQQQAIRAEEEGKAAATRAKWKQEEIKAVEVTKAEQAKEVAELQSVEAKFKAEKIIQEGRAEAEANRLKVQAGLTPQERAQLEKDIAIGVAEALAKSNVKWIPEIMVIGGSGSNSTNAMDAVGLNMMLDVVNKIQKK